MTRRALKLKHAGGIFAETTDGESIYYGRCKCGWCSQVYESEADAFQDFARHIYSAEQDARRLARYSESAELGENPRQEP